MRLIPDSMSYLLTLGFPINTSGSASFTWNYLSIALCKHLQAVPRHRPLLMLVADEKSTDVLKFVSTTF
jgi:hypothetical protein